MKKYGGASSQTNMVLYVILGIFLVGMIFFGVGFKVGNSSAMEQFQGEMDYTYTRIGNILKDRDRMGPTDRVLTPATQAATIKDNIKAENKAADKQNISYKWVCGKDGCKWKRKL